MPINTPKVTKGRFTIPATGKWREFMFNPNDVRDNKLTNFGATNIPGASHPHYQFGSGGERTFSFELYLDGDRGRAGTFGVAGQDTGWGLNVLNEIRWYQALLYPQEYDTRDFTKTYPYLILFSMGAYADAIPCILKQCPVSINYWTPKMEPVRATLNIELGEVVNVSKTYSDVILDF